VTVPVPQLRVSRVVARTQAEGPGLRSAVWVQGCTLACPGCFNPHTWSARGGQLLTVHEVLARLTSAPDVEGVTLLGGEPFEQAPALAVLAGAVRAAGLTVMAFTGHLREELEGPSAPEGAADLLRHVDLLVDGPYRRDLPDDRRPWVGSTNQRFHALTPAYADLLPGLGGLPDRLEVTLGRDGTVLVNGFADPATVEALLAGLGRRTSARPA
jgi:anaerobic ribonucleoside-triphosphate reductase activating protein